jgi:hypothetical protein
MKSICLAVLSAGASSYGGASQSQLGCIEGSGNSTTDKRQMSNFTQINLEGDYTVTLTQDSSMMVAITADDNLLQYITTTVKGGTLVISTTENICSSSVIAISIGIDTLSGLTAAGKDQITASGTITAQNLSLQFSGADTLTLDLTATGLTTSVNGQATINLTGSATSHSINVSGNGTLSALGFAVNNFTTNTSGAGKYQVSVADAMTLHTTGSSDVEYSGNPTIVDDNKGSSKITKVG